ncbi:unnamed protein product [Mytilus coruscus]|uniref:C2H2-type domain-containing protein n=1 Tax=Mytilus coruscus TaxID=42192 RepID=A0A6J8EH14_MYTCO|nr:unnamed protein product [Mytilus coruscus]
MFIPVDIPFCEKLSESCMIEPSVRLFDEENIAILPAILQTSTENKVVSLHNFNDTDIKIYPKMKLGDCESYYEKKKYLTELWERSCIDLNEKESIDFANLLKRYKNVFSKSSDDIGRTNLIQHEINTGNAVPIRQPPRRLPFGKRQIEKDEIKRMLNWMRNNKATNWASCKVATRTRIGTYDLTVVHRPGLKHRNADALSRHPCISCSRQERVNNANDSCDEDSEEKEHLSVRTVTRSKADTSPTRNQFVLLGWDVNTLRQQQLQDKIIDCFSKWKDAYGIPDQEAATVAKIFVNEFTEKECWICLEKFDTTKELKSHLASSIHSKMEVKPEEAMQAWLKKSKATSRTPEEWEQGSKEGDETRAASSSSIDLDINNPDALCITYAPLVPQSILVEAVYRRETYRFSIADTLIADAKYVSALTRRMLAIPLGGKQSAGRKHKLQGKSYSDDRVALAVKLLGLPEKYILNIHRLESDFQTMPSSELFTLLTKTYVAPKRIAVLNLQ